MLLSHFHSPSLPPQSLPQHQQMYWPDADRERDMAESSSQGIARGGRKWEVEWVRSAAFHVLSPPSRDAPRMKSVRRTG